MNICHEEVCNQGHPQHIRTVRKISHLCVVSIVQYHAHAVLGVISAEEECPCAHALCNCVDILIWCVGIGTVAAVADLTATLYCP